MLSQNAIAYLLLAGLGLPLLAGIFGLFGKNSKAFNTAVGIVNMLGAALGAYGAGAFLFLQDRGLFSASSAPLLDLARFFPFLPSHALSVDMLSAYFLLIINVGVFLAAWFSIAYLPRESHKYRFPWLHIATALFVFGMQLTVVSGTPLLFLFAWEVMSFAAYFLVIADRTAESIKAGFSYVIMTQLGAACLIAGFAIVSGGNMNALFLQLPPVAGAAATVGLILLMIGFAAKAGIFPFHEWLPAAHPQAPSSASALMSGVMLKVALYGLLRTFETVAHFTIPLPVIFVFLALTLFTAFYGALMAAVESDLKRALAWSSVENMGLMFSMAGMVALFFSLGGGGAAGAVWIALLVFAFCHMLFKSGLFMAAGALISQTHTRDLDLMGGLAKKWPLFSGIFLALCLCAAALPPAGTFYGEWIFLTAVASSIGSGAIIGLILTIVVSVFALAAGLAAFAMVKIFAGAFLAKPRSEHAAHVGKLPLALYASPLAAGALCVALGIALPYFLRGVFPSAEGAMFAGASLLVGGVTFSPLMVVLSLIAAVLAVFLLRSVFAARQQRTTGTWDCGAPLTSRMEYTATAFAAPPRFFFRLFTLPGKKLTASPVAPDNRWIVQMKLEHGTKTIAETFIYRPVARAIDAVAGRVKRLQNGVVQFYLALIFVALVVTLIIAL
jgi:hydrogenase-4 component B